MALANSWVPKNLSPAPMIPKKIPNPALAQLNQKIKHLAQANQPQFPLQPQQLQNTQTFINSGWTTSAVTFSSNSANYYTTATTPSYYLPVQSQNYGVIANYTVVSANPNFDYLSVVGDKLKLPGDRELIVELPDGSVIHLDKLGNFRLDDSRAKITYQANRMRAFNPFINASDLLAQFIKYLATLNLKKAEVQTLPLGLFINWLIIRAAETDMDPVPADVVPVPQHRLLKGRITPRCLYDQRFVERELARKGWQFCNPLCADRFHRKLLAA